MKNFSCSFPRLYGSGGFYESPDTASDFVDLPDECRWIANLHPAYSYDRPQPAHILSRDQAFAAELRADMQMWNATYAHGSSTDLFTLENGLLFRFSLYKAHAGEIVQMYETNRPNDRPWRRDLDPISDLHVINKPADPSTQFFYLGSIGSENYGHWLIDDLTRTQSLLEHFSPDRMPTIVLNSYNPVIDALRTDSLRVLTHGITDIEICFLDYRSAYFFPQLFFVSPSSHHPFLKSPHGTAFLNDHFVAQAARIPEDAATRQGRGKNLFVTRRARWRNLLNLEAVIDYFQALSFDIVELEGMSFLDQVRTFSQAKTVIGVMGAGMANTVFCPESTTVVQLAPAGWKDPFYWDLAAVKNHRYAVAFGETWQAEKPEFSSFAVDISQLDIIKSWL